MPAAFAAAASAQSVTVDTDAGSDDLLAIAFLLARADVRIEAITVANGLAHVVRGAAHLTQLLALAGKPEIPVYVGQPSPTHGNHEFPAQWRRSADELRGVHLPEARRPPRPESAAEFLQRRTGRILALGPLTNLAQAGVRGANLMIMGGALRVPGNLRDGGVFKTDNTTAEWNLFVDPAAAAKVFGASNDITLIALDATAKAPIDLAFLREFQSRGRTPLGRFAAEVLESDREAIEGGFFQAWDPLAAVALVDPGVVRTARVAVEVRQSGPEEGRTVEVKGRKPNMAVAVDANDGRFKRLFLSAFEPA